MRRVQTSAVALGLLLSLGAGDAAFAASATSEVRSTQGFRKAVTLEGVREHQAAFQKHADDNGGSRVAGSAAFEASRAYVMEKAKAAGLQVSVDEFTFAFNGDASAPLLRTASSTFVDGSDYLTMNRSADLAQTTAPVVAVDLGLPVVAGAPSDGNTSGCEPADFAGFPAGAIALLRRGSCGFAVKNLNAKNAGAVATIVMNEGNTPARSISVNGNNVDESNGASIGTTTAVGLALANGVSNGPTGSTVTMRIDRAVETRTTYNVIAETPTGDPSKVVVVGAHLDSVTRGAGINDNGSGSAGILEIAEQLGRRDFGPMVNKLRFMWYSAEEFGLLGSQAYVDELATKPGELGRIKAMLNFDMIGSPNYVRFVYDGDNSGFPVGPGAASGPEGSGEIERIFRDYFVGVGLTSGETPFSGRSDYGPFIAKGIPAGGLFTGAEGLKTTGQARVYGGEAGTAYDPCYHLFCDTLANVDLEGLDEMTDAAAHATWTVGKRDLTARPLVDGTAPVSGSDGLEPGGGGLHDEHDDHEEAGEG